MYDVTIPGSGAAIQAAAMNAIHHTIANSSALRSEVDRITQCVVRANEAKIASAIQDALDVALADPTLIGPMVRNALLASSSHMNGQFVAVMKRVGKDLALDRKTLEKLVEAIKLEITQNNEKLGIGLFS